MNTVERVVLTARPPTPEDWQRAAGANAAVRVLPGAAAQVERSGRVLLTVLLPREVLVAGEQRRLLGVDEPDRPWWSDVVLATPEGVEIVDAVAAACAGVVV